MTTELVKREYPFDLDLCLVTGNDAIDMTYNAILSAVNNTDLDLRLHIYCLHPSEDMKVFLNKLSGDFTKIVYSDTHFNTVEECYCHFKEALNCLTDTARIVGFLPANIILRPNWATDTITFLHKFKNVGIVGIYNDIINQNLQTYHVFGNNMFEKEICFVSRKFHVSGIQLMRYETYKESQPINFNSKYGISGFESLETSLNVMNTGEGIINVYLPNQWAFYYNPNEIYSFNQRVSLNDIELFDKHVKENLLSNNQDLYDTTEPTNTGPIY